MSFTIYKIHRPGFSNRWSVTMVEAVKETRCFFYVKADWGVERVRKDRYFRDRDAAFEAARERQASDIKGKEQQLEYIQDDLIEMRAHLNILKHWRKEEI